MDGADLARRVSPGEPVEIAGEGPHVVGIDTGIKLSIIRQFRERGCRLTLLPCSASAEQVLGLEPDLVFLANGPGDPAALDYVVETVRGVVGQRPVVGICLGHQLLCRAVGLETFKLPFGHRGANHPVKDLATGKIDITSQNHGFAVRPPDGGETIDADEPVRWQTDFGAAELTHLNLYDRTVEGLALRDVAGCTVQYHPEAGPGPHDARYLFDRFLELAAVTSMTNVELLREFWDLWRNDGFDELLARYEDFFTDDLEWHSPVAEMAGQALRRTRRASRRHLADLRESFTEIKADPTEIAEIAPDVVRSDVLIHGEGPTSGVAVDAPLLALGRLRDGRMCWTWASFDLGEGERMASELAMGKEQAS